MGRAETVFEKKIWKSIFMAKRSFRAVFPLTGQADKKAWPAEKENSEDRSLQTVV